MRIYDIFFDYDVLLATDAFVREVSARPEFQRAMSTAEFHYLLGGYLREREKALGLVEALGALARRTSSACRSTPARPATARSA